MRRLTVAGLLGGVLLFVAVIFESDFDRTVIAITGLMAMATAVAALPWRFAPLAGPLVGGLVCLVGPFLQPFTAEDLSQPERLPVFATAVLIIVFGLIATVCGFGAVLAPRADSRRPRWLPAFLGGAAGVAAGAGLVAWATVAATGGPSAANQVVMSPSAFEPAAVTLPTGSALVLVDAVDGEPHVLFSREAGLNGDEVSDGAVAAGPFREPGAFQIVCTIHEGMNLAVTIE